MKQCNAKSTVDVNLLEGSNVNKVTAEYYITLYKDRAQATSRAPLPRCCLIRTLAGLLYRITAKSHNDKKKISASMVYSNVQISYCRAQDV